MKIQWKIALTMIAVTVWCAIASAALPENIAAAAKNATAEKYPDADTVLLFDEEKVRYDEKGFSETSDAYFVKIMTEKGRRDNRLISVPFNRHYQTVALKKLVIHRDGGEIELAPEKLVSEESDSRSLADNICDPDDRFLRVKLPEVKIGDVIYFDFRTKEIAKRMPGVWQDIAVLQMTEPCLEYRYIVDAPETLPLAAVKLRNEVPGSVSASTEKRDGRILYTFTAKDVPQVFFERAMFGAKWHALQRYHLSTLKNWEELSAWYAKLAEPHLGRISEKMVAKVSELTKGCRSDEEKVAALFRFVSQQIRYMGLIAESEAPGYEPHDVSYTFDQRAGVCRDKAALLAAMLRISGLKAHMALISAGEHLDREVPLLHFNHAITAWEKTPGVFELLDPTAENTQETLPFSDADSSYLVATEKGETLRTTPAPPIELNAVKIKSDAVIDHQGKLQGHVVFRPAGIFETVYRTKMQDLLDPEREQFMQSLVDRIGGGILISHLRVTPVDTGNMQQNLVIEFDFNVKNVLPESNCAEALPIARFADALSFRSGLVGQLDLTARRYPMKSFTALVEENLSVKLPRILQFLELPAADAFKSRIADWESAWSQKDGQLDYTSRLALKTLCVEPEEYDALKTLNAKLKQNYSTSPIGHLVFRHFSERDLAAVHPGVDALVLADDISVKLLSATSMCETRTVRRKILTPGGVRNHAEIGLTYRPEREKIEIDATVTTPDGKVTKLSPSNIHEVDDPAFAGAPRYAKGKKLIVNLPGVSPGAVIETKIRRTYEKMPFLFGRYVFGGYSPMMHGRFALDCDAETKLKISDPTRNLEITDSRKNGRHQVRCETDNHLEMLVQKNQPPLFFFDDSILFSTGDLAKYAESVDQALQQEVVKAGPRVDAVAQELHLQDASGDEEKLVRIRDWADRHIRLAGPALNRLLPDEFSSPETTIADGYGNSSDRAIVIAALCRRAGLEYEFLLVSEYPGDLRTIRFLSRVPGLDFTRVLVRRKGSDYLLNDTGMYARLGATKSEGDFAVTSKGKTMNINAKVRYESGTHRKFFIGIKESGAARFSVETLYYGNEYEKEKRLLTTLTPELKRRYFESVMLRFSPKAALVGEPEIRFDSYPGSVSFSFAVPDFAARNGRFLAFDLPQFDELLKRINVGSQRQTPYWSPRQDLRLEYEIVVPPGFEPTTKADGRRSFGTAGVITYNGRSSAFRNKLSISHQLLMPKAILSAADAHLVELVHQKLNHPHERRIILENKAEKGSGK
ncbi:MAG: DUF3857 domain-containing protein [Victivallaceae bacterium]|nr:DUF3857 domain-containing protein [Victivallaceae bacterium]